MMARLLRVPDAVRRAALISKAGTMIGTMGADQQRTALALRRIRGTLRDYRRSRRAGMRGSRP